MGCEPEYRRALPFFSDMKLHTEDNLTFNSDNCVKRRNHTRITEERPFPRVLLVKTEVPCTQRQNPSNWFNYVTVEKFIDSTLVKTYHWIQTITPEELEEFLSIDYTPKKSNSPNPRADYFRAYYEAHREQMIEAAKKNRNEKYREYYERNRRRKIEQCKAYQAAHREQINERRRNNYKLKKEELCQDPQKDNSSEKNY